MQEFFEQQKRFNRKYYDVFLLPHLAGSNERVENTEESERSAIVTTRIDGGTHCGVAFGLIGSADVPDWHSSAGPPPESLRSPSLCSPDTHRRCSLSCKGVFHRSYSQAGCGVAAFWRACHTNEPCCWRAPRCFASS